MKGTKRLLSLALALLLVLGLLPGAALGADASPELNAALNKLGSILRFTTDEDCDSPLTRAWITAEEDGRVYAMSGNAGLSSSSSSLRMSCMLTEEQAFSFDYKAQGEGSNYDVCVFAVDGEELFRCGAEGSDWATFSTTLSAGSHTLVWSYTKDSSVNPTGDCFAVDNVLLATGLTISYNKSELDDFYGYVGDTFSFTVDASGTLPISYQWQYRAPGSSEWLPCTESSADSPILTGVITEENLNCRFRCVVNDGYRQLTTKMPYLYERAPQAVGITGSPQVNVGQVSVFEAEAYGSCLSYQWKILLPGAAAWMNVSDPSAQTARLELTVTAEMIGATLACMVTDRQGNTDSCEYGSILTEGAFTITKQPEDFWGGVNEDFRFTVAARGSGLSYQWQVSTDGGETWADSSHAGNKTATLTGKITAARFSYLYRCVLTDMHGDTLITDSVCLVERSLSFDGESARYRNVYADLGETVEIAVVAYGSGLSYQWQMMDGSGAWIDCTLPGADSAAITVTATEELFATGFRCVVTDRRGNQRISGTIWLGETLLRIQSQPTSQRAEIGETFRFHIEAEGSALQYQWQVSTDGGETWLNSSHTGNKTATLTGKATAARIGYQYRCVLTDRHGWTSTSNAAVLYDGALLDSVLNAPGGSLHFTAGGDHPWTIEPKDGVLTARSGIRTEKNAESTLTLTFTLDEAATFGFDHKGGIVSYANQSAFVTVDGTELLRLYGFSNDWERYERQLGPGEHTIVWTFQTADRSGADWHGLSLRNVYVGDGSLLEIMGQPADYIGAEGDAASFYVDALGDGLTYQWYVKGPNATKFSKSSVTDPYYDVILTGANSGRQLYCVVTDSHGNSLQTNTVTMSILLFTEYPEDYYGSPGETAVFTAAAEGAGLSYQWQEADFVEGAGTWADCNYPGSDSAVLSVPITADKNGYFYRCVVTNRDGLSLTSEAACLYVYYICLWEQPEDFIGAEGDEARFSVTADAVFGDGISYQWYVKNPGATKFSKSSITTPTYVVTLTAANSGRQLYCVISDTHGNTVQTDTVTMRIRSAVEIVSQPADYVGPLGSTASFTAEAAGDGLTYQWYVKKPSASSFSKSSIKTATYSVELTEARNGNQLYCVVTDAFGSSVQTNTVSMTVGAALTVADLSDYVGPLGSTASFTAEAAGDGLTYQWYVKK
ncbi:MAG: hypothetical protein IKP17_08885, partial [Oscillospiraceae bacterium]|nr:hypothetical protein [Oscillospiraceae bacterium]